jgi:hypothetical protein
MDLNTIKHYLEQAAKQYQVIPIDLTLKQFRLYVKLNNLEIPDLTKLGGFNTIKSALLPPSISYSTTEKSHLQQISAINKAIAAGYSSNAVFLKEFKKIATALFKGKIATPKYRRLRRSDSIKRNLTAACADWHVGSDLSKREVVHDYNSDNERRSIAYLAAEIADWKPHYRDETELNLLWLGDIINNHLHNNKSGKELSEQICRAIWYKVHFVNYLSRRYNRVRIYCATGNHDRDQFTHQTRAIHQKFDSHATVIYYSTMMACSNLKNVEFIIPYRPFVTWDLFGEQCFGTHGDTVLEPGNPSKDIKTELVRNKINDINASLDLNKYKLFVTGHVHTGSITYLHNNVVFITTGALTPADPYSISEGNFDVNCGQMMWESVPGYVCGDSRFVSIKQSVYTDTSLDNIIPVYPGLPLNY